MEENVALDSTKQKKFVKSIKGIKKLLKKNEQNEDESEVKEKNEWVKQDKPFSMRLKSGKVNKRNKRKPMNRGLVYLSHIPHGFYEHQMTEYFKQFGAVTNARVIKSKRTGNSKGYAFVEFKEPSVAQVVAETMNNYLMGKRLIKAAYIPPEKIRRNAFRKKWNTVHNPTAVRRMKFNKEFNADKDDEQNMQKARRLLTNLNKTKKKLSEMGINYDFFTPVDVPAELLDSLIKKEKEDTVKEEESNPKKRKMEKNAQKELITKAINNEKVKTAKQKKERSKDLTKNVNKQLNKKKKQEPKQEKITKVNKKDKKPVVINKKEQKIKEKQLKAAGVKSVEQFISIDDEDSDSSCDFDSDEYEKMLEEDDD